MRMCGLTSRIRPVTVYTKDLSVDPVSSFPDAVGEKSDSSRGPRTAALSSDLRANRVGLAESVTSSHQRGMSAKCRTCPPWDCIGLSYDPAWCRTVTSSDSDTFVREDTEIHPRRIAEEAWRPATWPSS